MTGKYAAATDVPVSRSRDEIERTLTRFGATDFAYRAKSDGLVNIGFEVGQIRVIMRMQLPERAPFAIDARGNERSETATARLWEQACRQRWRSLANGVKAKLALIDDGISTIEREFLADIMLPSGETVGDWAVPQVYETLRTGNMPPMLPGAESTPRIIALADGTNR